MPDMQSPEPSAAAVPALPAGPVPAFDDADYAFGCECADPALQIAYWSQEGRGAAADAAP